METIEQNHDKTSGSLAGFGGRKDSAFFLQILHDCLKVFFYITLASKEEADTLEWILSDSACSSVSRRILTTHPSTHLLNLMLLKRVNLTDLEALAHFMYYYGEINISQPVEHRLCRFDYSDWH